MPIVRINGKLVYFAHVPKAAGSAVEHYLKERFGRLAGINTGYGNKPKNRRWTRSSPQHIDFEALVELFPLEYFEHTFAVVRHPVSRLRSVYHYQRDWEKSLPSDLGLADWLRLLPEKWEEDRFYLDNHPRLMCDLVPPNAKVFRMEDGLDALVQWLNSVAGEVSGPDRIGKVNVTADRVDQVGEVYDPVPVTAEEVSLISKLYKKDFERFGYSIDWPVLEEKTQTAHAKAAPPKKILVFGGAGQIGVELKRQADVVALDRTTADLSHPDACAEIVRTTNACAVINAAEYRDDHDAENDTLASIINGDTPTAIAQAAAAKRIPFIQVSSDMVFSGNDSRLRFVHDTPSPTSSYGHSKLKGELGVRAAGGEYIILRTGWVFSAHGKNIVKTILEKGQEHNTLDFAMDRFVNPTAAADIAAACLAMIDALNSGRGASGTYHFASKPYTHWADFARAILKRANLDTTVNNITSPDPSSMPVPKAGGRLECSEITQVFGISLPDWRDSLNNVLRELRET